MPLKWKIDHAERLVTVTAEGEVTVEQTEEYLDAVVVADAMPYGKLVDCTAMVTHASDDDMMRLAARIRAYAGVMPAGAPCFLVATPLVVECEPPHLNPVSADRPPAKTSTMCE